MSEEKLNFKDLSQLKYYVENISKYEDLTCIFENNQLIRIWNARTDYINQLQQESQQLKEQIKSLSSKKPIKDLKERNDELSRRSREHEFREYLLERRVKEKDKIVEEAIKFMKSVEFDKTDKYISIGQYNEFKTLLEILKKYKGDNNE